MSNRKAQTATEYMIILAVVIIIALIVVGVLGGIPGIGGAARSRASSAYWNTADIAITSYSVTATGGGVTTLKIRNNLKDTITILYANLSASGSGTATFAMTQQTIVMGPGETKTFTGTVTNLCTVGGAGNSFVSNVWIKYTNSATGATYVFQGDGNQLTGTCAQ